MKLSMKRPPYNRTSRMETWTSRVHEDLSSWSGYCQGEVIEKLCRDASHVLGRGSCVGQSRSAGKVYIHCSESVEEKPLSLLAYLDLIGLFYATVVWTVYMKRSATTMLLQRCCCFKLTVVHCPFILDKYQSTEQDMISCGILRLELMHVVDGDSIWHTMEVLCAYGMRSRIWKESKFSFGGLTGNSPAVKLAALRLSDRREHGGQTGGGDKRGEQLQRSDRLIYTGQTDGIRAVRPASSCDSILQQSMLI
uniref:Uncharacterized protein n=1 Tax=Oryza sativa subsp. japonica TaxID=39947 RepID=Q60DU4_ORYSJ|nr:hypothetical protein [Oryza sativa Japonica Group]